MLCHFYVLDMTFSLSRIVVTNPYREEIISSRQLRRTLNADGAPGPAGRLQEISKQAAASKL